MGFTLPPARLTTRLLAPARVLAGGIGDALRHPLAERAAHRARAAAEAARPLGERLHVLMLQQAPEKEACARLVAAHGALAAEGRWSELLASIARADRARASAPGGARLAILASKGARAALDKAIAGADWARAADEIARLEEVAARHPGDYVAAQLLAQGHLDLGWARRSAVSDDPPARGEWQGFLSHTAAAGDILDRFDPIEEDSPLLAGTRYQLVRGSEDGEELFRDWYEDWSDLDPGCAEPHALHAVHLLPDWYGSLAEFDAEARAAVQRTAHVTGSAAYAVFYLSGAEVLGHPPALMDLGLFLRGLIDFHRTTGCQYRANVVAGILTELLHGYAIDAAPGSMRARMVQEMLDDHLRGSLREFHLPAWENGEPCIHWALEQVFGADLAAGAHVHVGPEGLEARPVA